MHAMRYLDAHVVAKKDRNILCRRRERLNPPFYPPQGRIMPPCDKCLETTCLSVLIRWQPCVTWDTKLRLGLMLSCAAKRNRSHKSLTRPRRSRNFKHLLAMGKTACSRSCPYYLSPCEVLCKLAEWMARLGISWFPTALWPQNYASSYRRCAHICEPKVGMCKLFW
mgnify:CR=1 FL=1